MEIVEIRRTNTHTGASVGLAFSDDSILVGAPGSPWAAATQHAHRAEAEDSAAQERGWARRLRGDCLGLRPRCRKRSATRRDQHAIHKPRAVEPAGVSRTRRGKWATSLYGNEML